MNVSQIFSSYFMAKSLTNDKFICKLDILTFRKAILSIFTKDLSQVKLDLYYEDKAPVGTHFTVSDSKFTDAFGLNHPGEVHIQNSPF